MADVYRDPEPRRRTVVVGKAEKADRERRRMRREREYDEDRKVPDVDELRKSRAEYYGRPVAERERERATYMPLDQELESKRDGKARRRPSTKVKEVKEVKRRDTERERDRDDAPRRHHSRRKDRVVEEEYVYRDARDPPPQRARSTKSARSVRDADVDDDRREYHRHEKPHTRVIEVEDNRPQTPEERVYTRYPAQAQASPEKSSKLSRSSTKIGSGSHRTRSSTIRSRSRSRSRRAGSIRGGRSVKTKNRDVRPPMPSLPEDGLPLPSSNEERRRRSFFNGFFFAGKARLENPRMVECLTCASDVPAPKTAVLGCGHTMCHRCLKRIFTMSVTDPQHMPPRCCTSEHIPLKFVAKLFDDRFKVKWNKKFEEYTTKNRLYCPARGCGTWIEPQDLRPSRIDKQRNIGICQRCSTRVCGKCGRKWHTNEDCNKLDKDEGARAFVKMAAESGWQRCYNCTATVERKEGCNHMTCRCGAEFCIVCGEKWKSCDCPWFNATQLMDEDRLPMPNDIGARPARQPDAARARPRGGYAEDQTRRREQERRDEEVARRMQGLEIDEWDEADQDRGHERERDRRGARSPTMERNWGGNDTYGFGNMAGHFLNDNFVQRASRILTGTFNEQNRDAANRLVREIRTDRAPPLPRTAVVDPIREHHRSQSTRQAWSRGGGERDRPVSRRMQADEILDGAGIPRQGSTRRRPHVERSPASREEVAEKRRSVLAGLATAPGQSRVEQWRCNVKEGEPDAMSVA